MGRCRTFFFCSVCEEKPQKELVSVTEASSSAASNAGCTRLRRTCAYASGIFKSCDSFTFPNVFFDLAKIPVAELHGLGSRRSLVEQGGVGDGQARDVTDHGLVVEERLQATLSDLRLVRRVLSDPENETHTINPQSEAGN